MGIVVGQDLPVEPRKAGGGYLSCPIGDVVVASASGKSATLGTVVVLRIVVASACILK